MSETFKIENEIWKDIGGYEGLYQVSNMGKVKSLSRTVKCREFTRTIKTRILKQYPRPDGYMQVNLKLNGKQKTLNVHRLVAEAFIPNPENKTDVDHINGNKEINSVSNLRWATRVENLNNRRKKKKGGNSKVVCINTGEIFETLEKAGKTHKIKPATIGGCCKGYLKYAGIHKDTGEKLIWEYV